MPLSTAERKKKKERKKETYSGGLAGARIDDAQLLVFAGRRKHGALVVPANRGHLILVDRIIERETRGTAALVDVPELDLPLLCVFLTTPGQVFSIPSCRQPTTQGRSRRAGGTRLRACACRGHCQCSERASVHWLVRSLQPSKC